jgi:hypothetical protein
MGSQNSSMPLIERSEFLIDENDIYYDELEEQKSFFGNGVMNYQYGDDCNSDGQGISLPESR